MSEIDESQLEESIVFTPGARLFAPRPLFSAFEDSRDWIEHTDEVGQQIGQQRK